MAASRWKNAGCSAFLHAVEHDAEKCRRFSGDIMLNLFDSGADSDFRSNRPKIIRLWGCVGPVDCATGYCIVP
ncbi:hypothetical protein CCGE531_17185 [Rhizobium sp. CCGE531]|nr:hypothetical protein CCGE531_17185 [Rhizobium sp. CCGE531]AYG73954.1 hypothetical protein CCGE532_16690 [Rhizobium sp. CCGE532]